MQVRTNLILFKICADTLGFNDTVCEDPTSDEYAELEDDIQRKANNFFMIEGWITSVPTFLYSCVIGSLSDDFGNKYRKAST